MSSADQPSKAARPKPFRRKMGEWLFFLNLPMILLILMGFVIFSMDTLFHHQRTFCRVVAKSIITAILDDSKTDIDSEREHVVDVCKHWRAGDPGLTFAVFQNSTLIHCDEGMQALIDAYPPLVAERHSKLNLVRVTSGGTIDDTLKHWEFLFRYRKGDVHVYVRTETEFEFFERLLQVILVALVLLIPPILWSAYYLSRKVVTPLNAISHGVAEFSRKKYESRIVGLGTKDEFQALVDNLNLTFDIVESNIHQLEEFSSSAAHEIRTPLSAIIGHLDVALRAGKDADNYEEGITHALKEARIMRDTLAQLLLIAKPGSRDSLQMTRFALGELVNEVIDALGQAGFDQEISFEKVGTINDVSANRVLLRDLLTNLTENAIKFSDAPVRIRAEIRDGRLVLQVVDEGIGMSEEVIEKAFDRLYQGDRFKGGSGLGLSICRWIAHAHGGTIELESSPGAGTTVTAILPIS